MPPGYGNVYLSGSTQDYWNRDGRDTQFQVGYNNNYKSISYGVSAMRQYNPVNGKWDNRVMMTVGLPLGSGAYQPYSSTSAQRDTSGASSIQESLSGTLGADNAISYGVNASHSSGGTGATSNSIGANVGYLSPVARLAGNVSKGRDYTQAGAGISGGIVAYAGGVAFTPSMGDTTAIVEADDAVGARIANGSGLRVDRWGHALVANMTPFSRNQVEIDPKGLPMNVELKSTTQQVAPTPGAVVKVKFETENAGRSAVFRLMTADGKTPPFGADVANGAGTSVGTVAQGGRVIVRGLKTDRGELHLRWGDAPEQSCHAAYVLPQASSDSTAVAIIDADCVPGWTTVNSPVRGAQARK